MGGLVVGGGVVVDRPPLIEGNAISEVCQPREREKTSIRCHRGVSSGFGRFCHSSGKVAASKYQRLHARSEVIGPSLRLKRGMRPRAECCEAVKEDNF